MRLLPAFLIAAVISGLAFAFWLTRGPETTSRDLAGLTGDVARGSYVARLAGCIACHTDAKNGGAFLGGGPALKTPFGDFYPPNITMHKDDGIGAWTLDDFARALSEGKNPAGDHYFPSFPFTFYSRLHDQDIVDLWVAMQTVPPAEGGRREHDVPFPFNLRMGAAVWQNLFFKPDPPAEPNAPPSGPTRGAYLVQGPGHCGACHSPRNLLGAIDDSNALGGGEAAGGAKVPPITAKALKIQGWTADDIVWALQSGIKPDGDVFGGSMTEVVRDATQYWSQEDRMAVAEWLLQE